jgi:hypothetical protein
MTRFFNIVEYILNNDIMMCVVQILIIGLDISVQTQYDLLLQV